MSKEVVLMVKFDEAKGEQFRQMLEKRKEIAQKIYEEVEKNAKGKKLDNLYTKELLPIDTMIVSSMLSANPSILAQEK